MIAYVPPNIEIATTVVAQNPYKGKVPPVLTTVLIMVGMARYRGSDDRVKMKNVFLRPITSETAAQPNRPA